MKLNLFLVILIVILFFVSLFAQKSLVTEGSSADYPKDLLVGVDIAYYNLTEFKTEVDAVSSYTNLIVIGTTAITSNTTLLDETCQYVYDRGLSFIIYSQTIGRNQTVWFQNATQKWGSHFLGIYSAADEFGGKQLDLGPLRAVWHADSYSDAAAQYVTNLTANLKRTTRNYNDSTSFPLFISDYALYWFDYKAGCNTVFAEFGWNYSRQLNVALCRGAATAINKQWGVMITWTYTVAPYFESGAELYSDLISAYDNGAKYILVFDSDKEYAHGILKAQHLDALKQFWQYSHSNHRRSFLISERVACVLPQDYGYGFRGPNDKIWGLWETDDLAYNISVSVNGFLNEYGEKLDIIYPDALTSGYTIGYRTLLSWGFYIPEPSPTPSTSSSTLPSPAPIQDPSPSPFSIPIETQTPISTLLTSTPTVFASPTQGLSPSPEQPETSSFPILTVCVIAAFAIAVVFVLSIFRFGGASRTSVVESFKFTFQRTWSSVSLSKIQLSGQGETLLSSLGLAKHSGFLKVELVTEMFGKVGGTLTLEAANGDKLSFDLSGTELFDGSFVKAELVAIYHIVSGTGKFQGATGNGKVSIRFTNASLRGHSGSTNGSLIGNIALQ